MSPTQSIPNPYGINVFGSAIVRVDPDLVSISFSVLRLKKDPKEAFAAAREGAQQVRAFLAQAKLTNFGASPLSLKESFIHTGGEHRFEGYHASIDFHVLLHELERMEEIVAGVINAGANKVTDIEYQTTRLKEIRADTRRRAVEAAREKAENYCKAAGVTLGSVIHIEDINPNVLKGNVGHGFHETQPDNDETMNAFNPGSIIVGGAVTVAYEIGPANQPFLDRRANE
jgi:uncharacterized protein YggE